MRWSLIMSLVLPVIAGCKSSAPSQVKESTSATRQNLCVAIRGNGHYISAHFGGLARIVEDIGDIDMIAGASSGAISAFIFESMKMNPSIANCTTCDQTSKNARLALLLKSTRGLIDAAESSPEAAAVKGLAQQVQAINNGFKQINQLDPVQAAKDIQVLLNNSTIASILNWELFAMLYKGAGKAGLDLTKTGVQTLLKNPTLTQQRLVNNPQLKYAIDQVHQSFATFGSFTADSQQIFFRPGVIDFFAFIEIMGRIGDFYAGRGPYEADKMEAFLNKCAQPAFGKPWSEFTASGTGSECANDFGKMTVSYFTKHGTARISDSRLNDEMGKGMPIVVPTAIIDGKANYAKVKASQDNYFGGLDPQYQLPFENVKVGYWAPEFMSDAICDKVMANGDEKGARCMPLGDGKWGDILPYSPAEPGLSRAQRIGNYDRVSLGGWGDLAPVDSLKALGCDNVVYLTRRSDESTFVAGIARLLNMDEHDTNRTLEKKLFDLNEPQSSISRSLERADVVWCTDWNSFTDFQVDEMTNEAYCAETVIRNNNMNVGPYTKGRQARGDIRGCTFKAAAGTVGRDPTICGKPR